MTFSLTWLPDVLEQAGLKVAEVPGWRTRGRAEMGTVRGVMCHHTATAAPGNMPTLGLLQNGRSDLAGPLAQLGLGRDGTVYVVAAGRANHAGPGTWEGIATGNSSFIGIEAENNGTGEPWPAVQIDAYQRCVAAILQKIGARENMCCGHKEYAPGRKTDPDFDMPAFRRAVTSLLAGRTPPPPIPAGDGPSRPTLRRGPVDPAVAGALATACAALGRPAGPFDADMEAAVRGFQRAHTLVPDGIIGPKTWAAFDGPHPPAVVPAAGGAAVTAPAVAPTPLPPADDASHPPQMTDAGAVGPDGKIFAHRWKAGVMTIGQTPLADFLTQQPGSTPPSVVRVLGAMAANEGGLEAINTWDDAHLSFGVFQWTAGADPGPSELPALLARLETRDPAAFQDCFGRYGLGMQVTVGAKTGLFVLNGQVLSTTSEKEALRNLAWAYRFWRAGHHPSLRLCEAAFAAERIDAFLTCPTAGHRLNEWLSSEYAIALILDEHVNRPGHVPHTLERAIALDGTADPTGFDDARETHLIALYLRERLGTMTHSDTRAASIAKRVQAGALSAKRGSFSRT